MSQNTSNAKVRDACMGLNVRGAGTDLIASSLTMWVGVAQTLRLSALKL